MTVAVLPIFHKFYNNVLSSTDQAVNNQVSHRLNSFLTEVNCIRRTEQWVVVGVVGFNKENLKGRVMVELWSIRGSKLTKMKAYSHSIL